MKKNFDMDTIVAVSTPVGEGGIGIVRVSGKSAIRIAAKIFVTPKKRNPAKFKTHTVHYGHVVDTRGKIIDEVLLTVMRAPGTYTKEDIAEINCHGGIVALRKVTELIVANGARPAEPGEFTKRAFLNGRLDLAQAEAVLDVIRAKTDAGLRASVDQLQGGVSKEIDTVRGGILGLLAEIEADIDFPEEDVKSGGRQRRAREISAARKRLERLAGSYHRGAILRDGMTAVICGKANVGKSSLMNLLLKRDRVIVTPVPGTTRDAIEELVNIRGIPIRLVDTAGIRKERCLVEKEGINKSLSFLSGADLVLCVLDGSERLKRDDLKLLKNIREKCAVIVINKCDRKLIMDTKEVRKTVKNSDIVKISCLKKKGIDSLEGKIYNKVWGGKILSSRQSMLNNVRHKEAIGEAIRSLSRAEENMRKGSAPELLSADIREGVETLGGIVGKTYTDDALDIIFSKFCIGK